MKDNEVVEFNEDYEFEAIDADDNPIGMRTIPKGTKCKLMGDPAKGVVDVEFEDAIWQADWGINDVLCIEITALKELS